MTSTPVRRQRRGTRNGTNIPRHTHFVYRVYAAESDELLYVGCTNNIRRRQREHHDTYVYRLDEVRYEFDLWRSGFGALAEERRQILTLHPRDNVRHVAKRDRPEWL